MASLAMLVKSYCQGGTEKSKDRLLLYWAENTKTDSNAPFPQAGNAQSVKLTAAKRRRLKTASNVDLVYSLSSTAGLLPDSM
jgi:hypothetical protein